MCIVLVLGHISKCTVPLQKLQHISVKIIFVGRTSEKLIPYTATRKKRQEWFRVILLECPGDLTDSEELNRTDFNGCGLRVMQNDFFWFLIRNC